MRYAVLRGGRLVFAQQHQEAIEFRVQTSSLYFDFRPILERHQRIFFERIKRGELGRGYNPYRGQAVPKVADIGYSSAEGETQDARDST